MTNILRQVFFCFLSTTFVLTVQAQSAADNEYLAVVRERAYKIAAPLGISDSAKFYQLRDKIAKEYVDIKEIDDQKAAATAAVKAKKLEKAETDAALKKITDDSEAQRTALNKNFVRSISEGLTAQQVEQVKDGLTYSVLPKTYQAHLDMIPSLKEEEKKYIYDALFEAREHAMAAGSSDAKHAWFGKYKGRINNYLAARGYNLTEERKGWDERRKARKP